MVGIGRKRTYGIAGVAARTLSASAQSSASESTDTLFLCNAFLYGSVTNTPQVVRMGCAVCYNINREDGKDLPN